MEGDGGRERGSMAAGDGWRSRVHHRKKKISKSTHVTDPMASSFDARTSLLATQQPTLCC